MQYPLGLKMNSNHTQRARLIPRDLPLRAFFCREMPNEIYRRQDCFRNSIYTVFFLFLLFPQFNYGCELNRKSILCQAKKSVFYQPFKYFKFYNFYINFFFSCTEPFQSLWILQPLIFGGSNYTFCPDFLLFNSSLLKTTYHKAYQRKGNAEANILRLYARKCF